MGTSDLAAFRGVLATSVPLRGLADGELDRVLEACRLVSAGPGDRLMEEGFPGQGLYIVLKGAVECFLPAREEAGRPTRVYFRREGAGESFGEVSLLERQPASASVQATEDTLLCLFPGPAFHRITEEDDRIGRIVFRNLLRLLSGRVREKDHELDDIEFI